MTTLCQHAVAELLVKNSVQTSMGDFTVCTKVTQVTAVSETMGIVDWPCCGQDRRTTTKHNEQEVGVLIKED